MFFCDDRKNLVQNPKSDSYQKLENVSSQRKDKVFRRFNHLYNEKLQKQKFSWLRGCYASYLSTKFKESEILILNKKIIVTLFAQTYAWSQSIHSQYT